MGLSKSFLEVFFTTSPLISLILLRHMDHFCDNLGFVEKEKKSGWPADLLKKRYFYKYQTQDDKRHVYICDCWHVAS